MAKRNELDINKLIAMIQALAPAADVSVIEASVGGWLEDHPEATTTVEDGAITEAKLAQQLATKIGQISSLSDEIASITGIDGTLDGSVGDYKYIRYSDGKSYGYANESYTYTFNIGSITTFKYNFTVSSPGLMGLAFYNGAGKFISGSGVQATTTTQIVTVPSNAVSCKATVMSKDDIQVDYNLQGTIEDIAELDAGLIKTVHTDYDVTPTTGYYVDYRDGAVNVNANMQYIQFPIKIGKYIQYNSIVGGPDVRGLAFYNAYGTFLVGYRMLSTPQTIVIPSDATLCKATVNSADDVYLVLTPDDLAEYADQKQTINILSAFTNITCIGDSLTWSQVYLANGTRKAYKPYAQILADRTGANTEEIANPGYNATQWWTANSGAISTKTNQLAIVYLGTNLGLSDTLDTDCVGDDPANWGDTLTADYCRIVNALKSVGSKVVLVKLFMTTGNTASGTGTPEANSAIEHIATRFGCGLVGPLYLADSAFHKIPDGTGTNAVHYNDLGYSAFVDLLINAIGHMDNEYMLNIVPG